MTLKFGILGDSDTDSYQADDDRGGDFGHVTFCVPEILVRLRSFDLGTWGSYAEPRRTDYAHNWSRSGATSHTMISAGQHTGLAAQVSNGDVEYCFIDIGTNNFHPGHSSPSLYEEVYDGTLSGSALQDEIDDCIDDMETAMDALINAGASGVVVALWHQWDEAYLESLGYTNATNRQRVIDTIDDINTGIIAACNSRGIPYAPSWDDMLTWVDATGTPPNQTFDVDGRTIDVAVGDAPTNLQLADTHVGTVGQCFMTNEMLLKTLNDAYGLGIALISEAEMLAIAGLDFPSLPVIDDFDRANGALAGGDWSQFLPGAIGALNISSNQVAGTTSGFNGAYWSAETFGPDIEIYATIATRPATNGHTIVLYARVQNPESAATFTDYHLAYVRRSGTDNIYIERTDPPSAITQLLTLEQELADGDSIGLRIVGDTLEAYYRSVSDGEWLMLGSVQDATYSAAGHVAMLAQSTTARLDDFGAGDFSETPPPVAVAATPGVVSVVGNQATVDVAASTVTVNAATGVVAVSGVQATIDASTTVQAATATVNVTGVQATVSAPIAVEAQPGVVSVSGVQATVVAPIVVSAATATVQAVGIQASVSAPTTIEVATGVVEVQGQQATVVAPIVVSAFTGVVQAVGVQATVDSGGVNVQASTAVVNVTGVPATIAAPIVTGAATATVTVSGIAATVDATTTIEAATAEIAATGVQAGIVAPIVIAASPGVVTVVGVPATISGAAVTVAAATGTVQVNGVTATIDAPIAVETATAVIAANGIPASIVTPVFVQAGPGTIAAVGVRATIDGGALVGDVVVTDAGLYGVVVSDAVLYSVELSDSSIYEVALQDASKA